jgi:hypothetical protein
MNTVYTKDTIVKGAKAGVYNTRDNVINYNYLIGDFGGSTVTLVNIKTGMIHTCAPSDIYMPEESKKHKDYLDYDQEVMKVGDKVSFRANNVVFEITKVIPTEMTCNLFSKTGTRLFNIPLSYLKFADVQDSIKEEERKVIKLNHIKKEKKEMTETEKKIKKAMNSKKETIKNKETEEAKVIAIPEKPKTEEIEDIFITVKKKEGKLIIKCTNKIYYSIVSIDKDSSYEDIKKAINAAYDIFVDEDKRKSIPFMPKENEYYCRYLRIGNEFKDEDLGWTTYRADDLDCFKDLMLNNVFRDAHDAKANFGRIKNDYSQKAKQLFEKALKAEEEED